MKMNYQRTLKACYLGFITQAIAANFAPLLFLKFHADYGISMGRIALISTVFYFTQLVVDVFCARFVDKIGGGVRPGSDRIGVHPGSVCKSLCRYHRLCHYICLWQWAD